MIDYTTLEDAIIAALAPLVPAGVELMAWPETEAEYNRPFAKSRVSVVYHSSKYGPLISAAESTQEESVSIQIFIQAQRLRGALGIYDIKSLTLNYLLGLRLPNFTPLYAHTFEMSERDAPMGGIFAYNLVMITKAISQQTGVDNYEDPFALSLTLVSNDYGNEDVTEAWPGLTDPDDLIV